MKKKLLIFIPHINVGGVEKNLYLVANYLAKRIEQISIITVNKEFTNKLDKKIKTSNLKTNDNLSTKILEVRELLSGEINSLNQELNILKDSVKDGHSELKTNIENSVSTIKKKADKDRENFNNQFENVTKAIATVDSKIVKEDDLTELFKNYTVNVNISGNEKPKKRKFLKR